MVRILFFFCGLLFSVGSAYGQFMVGSKIGAHVSKVQFEREAFKEQYDPEYKVGGNIGAAVSFPVKEPFSLYSELLFTYKGKSVNVPGESLNNNANYYYIEMPIMMRLQLWPSESVFLGIGPNLSYWLAGSGKIDDLESSTGTTSYKINFGEAADPDDLQVTDPHRLQLGLIFSLGKTFKLEGHRSLIIDARYEMGHSFLGTEQGAYLENIQFHDNLASKYQLISFNAGYFFIMHKKSKRRRSSTYRAKQRKD